MDLIVAVIIGIICWLIIRIASKQPIIPGMKKNHAAPLPKQGKQKGKQKNVQQLNLETFSDLFQEIKEIEDHMVRYHDNKFVMIAEVQPVNYFLLSQDEQENIDQTFETYLSQLNYPVSFYLQNRYIDLTDPIQEMTDNMTNKPNLNEHALEYGRSLINSLQNWQRNQPRFETRRYLVLYHTVKASSINADDPHEFEEKVMEKAFNELFRRMNTARNSLQKADMEVEMLTPEGITEVMYHALNRRKAFKNRFRDIKNQEQLAEYVTADQDDARIESVKEMIDREAESVQEKESSQAS